MKPSSIAASDEAFAAACARMPGGVNSPVRAFGAVGGTPRFIASARGSHLVDLDGNDYVDFVGSWGPMILGHANASVHDAIVSAVDRGWTFGAPTTAETELAAEVCDAVNSIEKIRMVNSGTEATMSAIRLARACTGRNRVIKFSGCYHGHHDALLVAAGSGLATAGTPSSPGVTPGSVADTVLCRFNDLDSVREAFRATPDDIACIIVEPVAGNMGVVAPKPGFLEGLRTVCSAHGALLVFDEVMTGFRVARGGAQARFAVAPDLTTLGKIIGGGMPVGAYGGRADLMQRVAPSGDVYQAGTLSGNPAAMAAGIATLRALRAHGAYDRLEALGTQLEQGLAAVLQKHADTVSFARVGSMFTLFFHSGRVEHFDDAMACDTGAFGRYFHAMLDAGYYVPPSQFEANFISLAHTDDEIQAAAAAMERAIVTAHGNATTR